MKLDIQNILYIVVIIAWAVVGYIKKSKKKEGRPATAMPPVGEPGNPDFSEVLDEILGRKKEEKKIIPFPVAPEPKKVKKITKSPSEISFHSNEKSSSTFIKTKTISDDFEGEPVSGIVNLHDSFPNDIRQAIIYSAILNRPYQ